MLNLKQLFLEAERKDKVKNFAHFEKDVCFEESDTFGVSRIFRLEGSI
jgi:hypothetical protein